jgi:hypothetical protein
MDSEEDALNAINNALARSPVTYIPSKRSGLGTSHCQSPAQRMLLSKQDKNQNVKRGTKFVNAND